MTATAVQFTVQMTTVCCSECCMTFAVPFRFDTDRRTDGKTFYCPLGHAQHYGVTEVARLQKELEAERRRLEFAKNEARIQREEAERINRRLIAAKGQMTKLRKRVGRGVCPCCNRTFANVQRHMTTKHPDFAEPAAEI